MRLTKNSFCLLFIAALSDSSGSADLIAPAHLPSSGNCIAGVTEGAACKAVGSTSDRTALLQSSFVLGEALMTGKPADRQDEKDVDLSRAELLQKAQLLEASVISLPSHHALPEISKVKDMNQSAYEALTAGLEEGTQALTFANNVSLNTMESSVDDMVVYLKDAGQNLSMHSRASTAKVKLPAFKNELQAILHGLGERLLAIKGMIQTYSIAVTGGSAFISQTDLAGKVRDSLMAAVKELDSFLKVLEAASNNVNSMSADNAPERFRLLRTNLRLGVEHVHAFKDKYADALDEFIGDLSKAVQAKLPEEAYEKVRQPLVLLQQRGHDIVGRLSMAVDEMVDDIMATILLEQAVVLSGPQILGIAILSIGGFAFVAYLTSVL